MALEPQMIALAPPGDRRSGSLQRLLRQELVWHEPMFNRPAVQEKEAQQCRRIIGIRSRKDFLDTPHHGVGFRRQSGEFRRRSVQDESRKRHVRHSASRQE
jgi:hypothetical protein